MPAQTTPAQTQDAASASAPGRIACFRPLLLFLLGFLALYAFFWWLQRAFPYLRAGSDLVYQDKLLDAAQGNVFPRNSSATRIAVFGDSTILAGLASRRFDEMAKADGLDTYTYNFGLPGHPEFLPLLEKLVDSGNAPDLVLLTLPWQPKQVSGAFELPWTDEEIANTLFPFRTFFRDSASFVVTSRLHGGLLAFYRQTRENVAQIRKDHGYYFIGEQSRFPNERLPEDFHLVSDQPNVPQLREVDPFGPEISELNTILRSHSIRCLYVPFPVRGSSMGQPPLTDKIFQHTLETKTPCKLLGPDYYRYPNQLFSDQMHLNHAGAKLYTEDLYKLVKPFLAKDAR